MHDRTDNAFCKSMIPLLLAENTENLKEFSAERLQPHAVLLSMLDI